MKLVVDPAKELECLSLLVILFNRGQSSQEGQHVQVLFNSVFMLAHSGPVNITVDFTW